MPTSPAELSCLIERLVRGERRVIAELLTRLERQAGDTPQLIGLLRPHLGKAFVAGVTGPPGAGKSTLVNALIAEARADGLRVAVLAVDPSSPVTGGAILGDRVRMTASHDDDGVLIRSLGSRGTVGGLTPAAVRMIDALDAAGFGLILVETVGTGQSEVDVAEIADVVVVVSAPGLGDGIQAMKAGLLEIADILVVNKADRDGADRTAEELAAGLALRVNAGNVPVMKTSAIAGTGVRELWCSIAGKGKVRMAAGIETRRRRRARYLIARAAEDVIAARMRDGDAATDALVDAILAGEVVPLEAAVRLLSENVGR
jgi:LAO/AO transport system kinase